MEATAQSATSSNQVQQFNLKWTNHTYNMLQTFTEQLLKENFVDCTLTCDGQFIRAHKMILSGCSHYFEQLFDTYKEPNPLIIMNGIKFINLKQIIEFMYHGEVKIMAEELDALLHLAEIFKVKGLSNVRNKDMVTVDDNNCEKSDVKKRKLSTDNDNEVTEIGREIKEERATVTPEEVGNISEPEKQQVIPLPNQTSQQSQITEHKLDKRPRILKRDQVNKSQTSSASTSTNVISIDAEETDNTSNILTYVSKIRRPPNAFMIFANEWRRKIAEEHPGENNKNISVHLGNMWKQLNKTEKDKYYKAAQQADREHKTKYPGYYYSPKEARMRKEMKTSQSKVKKPLVHPSHFLLLSNRDEQNTSEIETIN